MNNVPMEYTDEDGLHVMCACGHYVSGGVKSGQKVEMCPNCMFLIRFQPISVVYEDQLPADKQAAIAKVRGEEVPR